MKLHFLRLVSAAFFAVALTLGCSGQPLSDESSTGSTSNKSTGNLASKSTARFRDIAVEAGVNFVPRNGHEAGHLSILESLGTGVALFDYDRDDWPDIFFPGGGEFSTEPSPVGLPSAMFRNMGEMKFTAVGDAAGVARCPFYSHGACVGDFDADGFPDLLITGYQGLLLYQNQGDGTFVDKTTKAGLTLRSWSTSATWGDANGDGVLDLYIANYVDWSFDKHPACTVQGKRDICSPKEFQPLSDVFYLGNGEGTFRDATTEVGLVPGGKGLGVVAADLDNDSDLDYYVANDTTPNFLYRNDGQGHFQEVGLISGTAFGELGDAEGSMGADVGDFNGDGLPDLWVANFENQSFALYRNEGDCHFLHVSGITGITAVGSLQVGFGTCFVDFDLDGDLDLFATNGHVMYHSTNAQRMPLPSNRHIRHSFVRVTRSVTSFGRRTRTSFTILQFRVEPMVPQVASSEFNGRLETHPMRT